jgi:hypothetical protein
METTLIRKTKSTRKKINVHNGCPSIGIQSVKPGIITIHMGEFNELDLTREDAKWVAETLLRYYNNP